MKVSALAFLPLIAAEADLLSNPLRDLAGGQYIPCPGNLVKFETSVLVDFDGFDDDPNDVTRIGWQALEVLFKDSYNSLSSYLCDEEFREVLTVTVERDEDGSKIIRRGGDMYSIRFTVEAQCRGCDPDETTLFSPPGSYNRALEEDDAAGEYQDAIINEDGTVSEVGHRLAKSSKSGKGKGGGGSGKGKGKGGDDDDYYYWSGKGSKKSSKKDSKKGSKKSSKSESGSQKSGGGGGGKGGGGGGGGKGGGGGGGGDNDFCKCDSSYPEYRAPTEEEFRVVYDSAIRDYKDDGYVPPRRGGVSVDVITRVAETVDLECSEVTEEFSALVSVEFFGDARTVTEQERQVLEENFVYTYNALQAERCDSPLFRSADLADIAMQADPEEDNVFIYIFRVDGICHGVGCSANLTLFDPPTENDFRKLHFDSEQGWDHARPDSGCSCPVFTEEFGAPTTDDFEVRFFSVVQQLKARGQLPNVGASGNVIELPFGMSPAPTTAPTATGVPGGTPVPTITGVPGGTPVPTITGVPGGTAVPTITGVPTGVPGATAVPTITAAPTGVPGATAVPTISGAPASPSISPAPSGDIPRGDTPAPSLSSSPTGGTFVTPVPTSGNIATPAPTGVTEAPTPFGGATPAPTANSSSTLSPTIQPTTLGTPAPTSNSTISPAPSQGATTPVPTSNATISPAPTQLDTPLPTSNATDFPTTAPTTSNATTLPPTLSAAPSIVNVGTLPPSISFSPSGPVDSSLPPSISPAPSTPGNSLPPSISPAPSTPGNSLPPSISSAPSISAPPTSLGANDTTLEPSTSFQPSPATP